MSILSFFAKKPITASGRWFSYGINSSLWITETPGLVQEIKLTTPTRHYDNNVRGTVDIDRINYDLTMKLSNFVLSTDDNKYGTSTTQLGMALVPYFKKWEMVGTNVELVLHPEKMKTILMKAFPDYKVFVVASQRGGYIKGFHLVRVRTNK